MEEQERLRENVAKKERERMLEDQTLYVFDSENLGADAIKFNHRKLTDCEIDVKSFLLTERKKRSLAGEQSSQEDPFEKFK